MGGCLFVGRRSSSVGDKILMQIRPACKPATPTLRAGFAGMTLKDARVYFWIVFSRKKTDSQISFESTEVIS